MFALPADYPLFLENLKIRIRQARLRASLAANVEMLTLYWQIGKTVLDQHQHGDWGGKVIDRLAMDLRREFPEMKGVSHRNITYMKQFAATYPDIADDHLPIAQLPWSHHIILMDKVKRLEERWFYMAKAIEQGWSRNILITQIASGLYHRQHAVAAAACPVSPSRLAQQLITDPYLADFLARPDANPSEGGMTITELEQNLQIQDQ